MQLKEFGGIEVQEFFLVLCKSVAQLTVLFSFVDFYNF
jgi:hypothetical protein